MVVEQLWTPNKLSAQALQVGLQIGQRSTGIFGLVARNEGVLERFKVALQQIARQSTGTKAPTMAAEGEPFFEEGFTAWAHGEGG